MINAAYWLGTGLVAMVLTGCGLLVAFGLRKTNPAQVAERSWLALAPVCVFLVVSMIAICVLNAPRNIWDSSRIAACISSARGIQVYSSLNEGSIQTTMYPVGWLLAYWPCAIASEPASALFIGNVLTLIYLIGPFAMAAWCLSRRLLPVMMAVTALVAQLYRGESTWWIMNSPHADAPALGCAIIAALATALAIRKPRARGGLVVLSGAAVLGAIWCKQVLLPISVVVLGWVMFWRGSRMFLQYVSIYAVVAVLLLMVSLGLAPLQNLWLNLVAIPSRCPWMGTMPFNLLAALLELLRHSMGALLFVVIVTAFAYVRLRRRRFLGWIRESAWPILLGFYVLMIPITIISRVKVGAWVNTNGLAEYMLIASVCMQMLELHHALDRNRKPCPVYGWAVFGMVSILTVVTWMELMQAVRYGISNPWKDADQEAYVYLRNNPGACFFPSRPLVHLLAEGRLYHYVQAMADREEHANMPISVTQRKRHWPDNIDMVAWAVKEHPGESARGRRYFEDFQFYSDVAELPGYHCYRRNVDAQQNLTHPSR